MERIEDGFRLNEGIGPGTYFVTVRSEEVRRTGQRHDTGDYTLRTEFAVNDHGRGFDDATTIALNGELSGTIDPRVEGSSVDFFRVEVTEPGILTVYTTGSLNTQADLYDIWRTELFDSAVDGGEGGNFRIEREVGAGIYIVVVVGSPGDYTIHTEFTPHDDDHGGSVGTATDLPLNGELSGTIDPATDIDYFRLNVTEGGILTVYAMATGSTHTFGSLYDGEGNRLATGHYRIGGTTLNFRIEREVDAGTYFVSVEGYVDYTGDYTIHAEFKPK